ncbi:aldose epimerase family protein [Ferruginibacter sp.]|nr:galactose mutarotase [Ferruginibacter sp.]
MKDGTENMTTDTIVAGSKKSASSINLHTIENGNGTRLVVSDLGAAVVSLFVKDTNGNFKDVVLGYDTPSDYQNDEFYLGTVVGRYANRVAGGTVVLDNATYKLHLREGGYHLHGGLEGFNKKTFQAVSFKSKDKGGVIFKYTSPHLEEGFPGELQLEVMYTLDDDDVWSIEYKAVSNKTTLVNFTQHTYFNLSGNPANTIDDHELKLLSQYYLPVNKLQVPTGEIANVNGTPFDFKSFKKIGQDILQHNEQLQLSNGYDHSFVLEKQYTPILKHAAIVKEPVFGIIMDVYTTEPAVHLYTGNFLDNVKGKNGILYNKRSAFCLETQHFPDAPNHPHFPSTILKAGEQFYSKTIFKFSVTK